jgi:hypothetical protein
MAASDQQSWKRTLTLSRPKAARRRGWRFL